MPSAKEGNRVELEIAKEVKSNGYIFKSWREPTGPRKVKEAAVAHYGAAELHVWIADEELPKLGFQADR